MKKRNYNLLAVFSAILAINFMAIFPTYSMTKLSENIDKKLGEIAPPVKIESITKDMMEEEEIAENLTKLGNFINRSQIYKMIGSEKKAILTFDDGPHPRTTPKILDILKKRNIKAIFFVLGLQAKKYPDLIKRIHDEGHLIGNHTFGHKNLTQISKAAIDREILNTNNLIQKITGNKPRYFRPPYGAINKQVANIIRQEGMDIVLWTVDPRDWKNKNPLTTLNSLSRQMKLNGTPKGGVVLLHDIYPATVQVLGPFLDKLAIDDFQICSIDNSSSSEANVSSKFWAATAPKISRSRISNNFDVELSGNQYLISFYAKKEVEISSIELLRARKTGQLMQLLISKNL